MQSTPLSAACYLCEDLSQKYAKQPKTFILYLIFSLTWLGT